MRRDPQWTRRQMGLAVSRFGEVFGEAPRVHGAAGWQMSEAALELEEQFQFRYASDTRGTGPFRPLLGQRVSACPQLPTTLPTLDELIGLGGVHGGNVHEALLARTRVHRPHQVFTLHAELEGMKLLPALRRLLVGWRDQGYELVSIGSMILGLELAQLPVCAVRPGTIPGRSGVLAVQGAPSG